MIRLFRVYVPESLVWLGFVEIAILVVSIYLGVEMRFLQVGEASKVDLYPLWPKALLFAFAMLTSMTAMGLYWHGLREGSMSAVFLRLVLGFLMGIVALSVLFYVLPGFFIGRGALGIALAISLVAIAVARSVYYHLSDQEVLKRRVLVLGAGKQASMLEKDLCRKVDRYGCRIVGYVHLSGEHDLVDDNKLIKKNRPLLDMVYEHQIDELVIAVDDRRKHFPVDEILECKMNGVEVVDLVTLYERQLGKIKIEDLRPSSMIFADGFTHAALKTFRKRVFDVVASIGLLLFTWPIMLLTASAIWLESGGRGPIWYRQRRVGKNGKTFYVLKFRSMRVDAESDGKAEWAQQNDDRVTRTGSVIRKFRIDELPQLLNVLRGDMSFVGPRPERPEFVEKLSEDIPYYSLRHKVNPGITGWAQISYPYGASEQDALEKLQYDLYYMKNYGVLFDLIILFQTAHTVLWHRGAR